MAPVLILLDERGRKHAIEVDRSMARVPQVGTFETAKLRASIGRRVTVGGRKFLVLEPSSRDLRETMSRGPQVLTPKDVAATLYEADVIAGARVAEAGAGSGGLTVALARVVGPSGRVFSYEVDQESLRIARANVAAAGVQDVVEFRNADVRAGIPETDMDAVVLDIVDPWSAIRAAWAALRVCGHLATFSPNMEQAKETVMTIRKQPFVEVRTIELIEREIEVREVGVRPSFAALGHTGYLTFACKVLEGL